MNTYEIDNIDDILIETIKNARPVWLDEVCEKFYEENADELQAFLIEQFKTTMDDVSGKILRSTRRELNAILKKFISIKEHE